MRELPRFVALGLHGPAQPRLRLIETVLLHQVDPDVVVGVAEVGIEVDGDLAMPDGQPEAPLYPVHPTQKCVGVSGGMHIDGLLVLRLGAVDVPVLMPLIPFLQQSQSLFALERRHQFQLTRF